MNIRAMLERIEKDLSLYTSILDEVAAEITGPDRCRVALENIRGGIDRSCMALSIVAAHSPGESDPKDTAPSGEA